MRVTSAGFHQDATQLDALKISTTKVDSPPSLVALHAITIRKKKGGERERTRQLKMAKLKSFFPITRVCRTECIYTQWHDKLEPSVTR